VVRRILQKLLYRLMEFGARYRSCQDEIAAGFLSMGEHSYGCPQIIRFPGDRRQVRIGKFCSIAPGVKIFVGGNHNTQWVSTYPFRLMFDLPGKLRDGHPASKGDVVIGSDVWLGYGATIFSGVQIGHGAVIAGQAVVTHDVPPYYIAAGNPARLVRPRFEAAQIQALLQIAWWDWPLERILGEVDGLSQGNIDAFIQSAQATEGLKGK